MNKHLEIDKKRLYNLHEEKKASEWAARYSKKTMRFVTKHDEIVESLSGLRNTVWCKEIQDDDWYIVWEESTGIVRSIYREGYKAEKCSRKVT